MLKKQIFEKTVFPVENILVFFMYYWTWQTPKINLKGYIRCFDKFCANYMIISSEPKKSRTKFSTVKAVVPLKWRFRPFFSHYWLWQTSSNLLLGSTNFFGKCGASYRIISLTPKRMLETQIFEKKAVPPMENNLRQTFLVLSNMTNLRKQYIRVQKVIWQWLRK